MLEHRWKSGAALFEMHIHRELAGGYTSHQQVVPGLVTKVSTVMDSSLAAAAGPSGVDMHDNELLEQLRPAHVKAQEGTAEAGHSRQHAQAELEGRRHARRLRRQQVDMAAAVAGAVVGVEPRAVVAAAQAKLLEERRTTGAAASFRGAGSRLRQWEHLRDHFSAADTALLRQPRVVRSVNEALQAKGHRRPAQDALLSREEELELVHAMRVGLRLHIFMAAWRERAGRAPSPEELAAHGLLGAAQSVRQVLDAAIDAQSRLVSSNVRMVHKVALQYRSSGIVSYEDLVQAGLEGLHDGLRRFEPARGSRLGTCLYFSIRNCVVQEYRRQNRVVAVPGGAQAQHMALDEALVTFKEQNGRKPTFEELSAASGFSHRKLPRLLRLHASREVFSGAPCGSANDGTNTAPQETWGDMLAGAAEEHGHAQRAAGLQELQRMMDSAIRTLPAKEQTALRSYYGLDGRPRTQKEARGPTPTIGEMLSTSEAYVSQLLNNARKHLRRQHAQTLLAYL